MREEGVITDVSVGVNRADSALKIIRSAPHGSFNSVMIAGTKQFSLLFITYRNKATNYLRHIHVIENPNIQIFKELCM
jgi:hypothetical protein